MATWQWEGGWFADREVTGRSRETTITKDRIN